MILLKTSLSKNNRLKGLLYLYAFLPFVLSRGRAASASSEIDLIAIIQIVMIFFIFGNFILSGLRVGEELRRLWRFKPTQYLLFLNFLFFLSVLWSSSPLLSLWRSLEWLLLLMSISFLSAKLTIRELVSFWWKWALINGAIFSLIFVHGISGSIDNYHGIWVYYATGIMFYPWRNSKINRDKVVMLVLTVLSTSSKVFVGIALAVLSWLLISRGKSLVKRIFSFIVAIGITLFFSFNFSLLFYGKTEDEIENGSGRLLVWDYAFELIPDKFWLGYGFTAGEKLLASGLGLNIVEAHNSFLSVMLSTGIIGLLLLFFSWLSLYIRTYRLGVSWLWMSLVCSTSFMFFDNSFGTRVSPAVLSTWALFFIIRSYYEENSNNK